MVIVIFAILVTQVFGLDKPTCPADKPTCGQVKVDGEWLIGEFFHFPPPTFFSSFFLSLFFCLCPFVRVLNSREKQNGACFSFLFSFFSSISFSWSMFIYSFSLDMLLVFFVPERSSRAGHAGRAGHALKPFLHTFKQNWFVWLVCLSGCLRLCMCLCSFSLSVSALSLSLSLSLYYISRAWFVWLVCLSVCLCVCVCVASLCVSVHVSVFFLGVCICDLLSDYVMYVCVCGVSTFFFFCVGISAYLCLNWIYCVLTVLCHVRIIMKTIIALIILIIQS